MAKEKRSIMKNYDLVDILAICVLGLVLCGMAYYLYRTTSWFYLDTPFFLTEYTRNGIFGAFFTKTDRFYPLIITINSILSTYVSDQPRFQIICQFIVWCVGLLGLYKLFGYYENKCSLRILVISLMGFLSTFGESVCTLGKMEIVLSVFIIYSFLHIYRIVWEDKKVRVYDVILLEICIFFSFLTKETALILLAPCFAVLVYTMFFDKQHVRHALLVFGMFMSNLLAYFVYRKIYVISSGYTSYSNGIEVYFANLVWYVKIHWDIMIVGGIGGIVSFVKWFRNRVDYRFAFLFIINLTGWAYLLAMSFWRWTMSYYLYPMVMFFTISFISVICIRKRIRIFICLSVAFILINSVDYNYKVVTSHVDMEKVFTDSINSIIKNTNCDDRVLVENYSFYEEQVREANILLDYYEHPVNMYGIAQEISNIEISDDIFDLYGYNKEEYEAASNIFVPRIGDYILVYYNDRNYKGRTRGLNPSQLYCNGESVLFSKNYQMELIDQEFVQRQWHKLNLSGDLENVMAGYALYKVTQKGFFVGGLSEDGWMGKELILQGISSNQEIEINTGYFASAWGGATTNTISIYLDDKKIDDVEITTSGKLIKIHDYISEDVYNEESEIKLVIKDTDSPKNYGSEDDRELGVLVEVLLK